MQRDARITIFGATPITFALTLLGMWTGEAVLVATGTGLGGAAIGVGFLFDFVAPE